MSQITEAELLGILQTALGSDTNIDRGTQFSDIKGWSSLSNVRVIVEIERKLGVRFAARDIVRLKSFGDLVTLVEAKQRL